MELDSGEKGKETRCSRREVQREQGEERETQSAEGLTASPTVVDLTLRALRSHRNI